MSPSKTVGFICFTENPLKRSKVLFSHLKSSLFLYMHFCPDVLGHVGKLVDKKAKVNFKICDVIYCKE